MPTSRTGVPVNSSPIITRLFCADPDAAGGLLVRARPMRVHRNAGRPASASRTS
jgi:hypothetical protein